ncbi:MAG: NAD(P)/FAD-dependent oxidoreductase [Acidobacteria bacterium]|nr:NAD(P)/FAD-dependent oxidoreductase [Acidobacteriota bacterium]MBI3263054.1 NAD(P)/FAD-dependent oxidoreductase [Acidobacteriota bacterium]
MSSDIVVVGAGHNGLVLAGYLARAGFRPLVLERRPTIGGVVVTEEFHPGFQCPTIVHTLPRPRPELVHYLDLPRHGLQIVEPDPVVFAPSDDGRALAIYRDAGQTAEALRAWSKADADAYPAFEQSLGRIGAVIEPLLWSTPPSIDEINPADLWQLLKTGRRFRGLGAPDSYRLLRYAPMAVADLVAEWFETDLLRATLAAEAIRDTASGPWSPGTGGLLLLRTALAGRPAAGHVAAMGGIGSYTRALGDSARKSGAEIRTGTDVTRILVEDGAVRGVALANGEEIAARVVISNVDPKQTLLRLVDPAALLPDFVFRVQNIQTRGTVAKINLALSGLPSCPAASRLAGGDGAASTLLRGRIHIGPDIDYLERAFDTSKYGQASARPYLDVAIPTLVDPALAPQGCHVMSIHAQFMPYHLRPDGWDGRHERLAQSVIETLSTYFPDLDNFVVHGEVFTPADLESLFGLSGGHLLQGEPALHQLFGLRPVLGWAQYRTPIEGLYLCGSGTHPGVAVCGASGANAAREVIKHLRKRRGSGVGGRGSV